MDNTNQQINQELKFPVEFFKALSDENRTQILIHLIKTGERHTVTELASCCPIDFSVVSRHLKILKEAGIVKSRKKGKEVYYRVKTVEIADFFRNLANNMEAAIGTLNADECVVTETEKEK